MPASTRARAAARDPIVSYEAPAEGLVNGTMPTPATTTRSDFPRELLVASD